MEWVLLEWTQHRTEGCLCLDKVVNMSSESVSRRMVVRNRRRRVGGRITNRPPKPQKCTYFIVMIRSQTRLPLVQVETTGDSNPGPDSIRARPFFYVRVELAEVWKISFCLAGWIWPESSNPLAMSVDSFGIKLWVE